MSDNIETLLEHGDFDRLIDPESMPALAAPVIVKHSSREVESLEELQAAPSRIRSKVRFTDVRGFMEYVKTYKSDQTVLFAKADCIEAVFDYHQVGKPAWGDHKASYALIHSPEWRQWADFQGKSMDQRAFAAFLEERADTISQPSSASLLTLIREMRAVVTNRYASLVEEDGVNSTFEFKKSVDVKAGASVELPRDLEVSLRAYDGLEAVPSADVIYVLKIKLGYDLDENSGTIRFHYKILNWERICKRVFEALQTAISEELNVKTFVGGSLS